VIRCRYKEEEEGEEGDKGKEGGTRSEALF
jgi:hypothetical protein